MKLKLIYILLLSLVSVIFSEAQQNSSIKLLTNTASIPVGEPIVLKFSSSTNLKPLLYCSNSYGSTVLASKLNNNILEFTIPTNMTNKIGAINWKILGTPENISGHLTIVPKPQVASMETYIGPPSIEAGGTDYSMLVVIPTDSLDNPVPTNTLVNVKHQFINIEETNAVYTKNLIAYRNIYAHKKDGRILVSSESLGTNSKEFTVNAMPAIPSNFTIMVNRPHNYADGNQITTCTTSVIKDAHNNVVSDGTFVNFFITNNKGYVLKSSGLTINGIATAKIIHPDYGDTWRIKAYVEGMAESNSILVSYQQVIQDFEVAFKNKNRNLTIGPLQSFMKQMIPDGMQVKLQIHQNNKRIETFIKTSFNGYVTFNLKPEIFKNGTYDITVETAGITKEFKTLTLW
ncbi:hypothetical protein PK35_12090 [Tamlana nanhaiensis]|uniref:Secretion system C-terminal sorting domain-containing protein n=1 Tax=Neotamlana nanhaiensis TaxID=1382798 RepID=A0A0D7W0V8_9FLAO|nr:hypothetical protein [Tamlana nanhaiensis]KJD32166.1 hypothetical protein PK35_11205 [Tamlana nanhaiensis]KJD32328.1 hypothetical protein PK35_12090 [Tamlana nanhaiensis]